MSSLSVTRLTLCMICLCAAFLNLASTTPFAVASPPVNLLPHLKQFPPLDQLHEWVENTLPTVNTLIISCEMFLYGGLIASRSSNDTTEEVMTRLQTLIDYKTRYPNLTCYLSSVVMRIPSYNEDVEEPDYWALYGADLYTYSYYMDKYNTLHNVSDLQRAEAAEALVPPAIVQEFLWRRARNFNVSVALLQAQAAVARSSGLSGGGIFERIWITLDDNAQYGFNIREANELRALVVSLGLQNQVNM